MVGRSAGVGVTRRVLLVVRGKPAQAQAALEAAAAAAKR